jgi:hypothetical protein
LPRTAALSQKRGCVPTHAGGQRVFIACRVSFHYDRALNHRDRLVNANTRPRPGIRGVCSLLLCLFFGHADATVILGHVSDSVTHQPIADANVDGSTPAEPGLASQIFSTQTDVNGYYQADVPGGQYSTVVAADSYLTIYSEVIVGNDPVVADFAMSRPATISGTVRAAGNSVAFTKIVLIDGDQGTFQGSTFGDADGKYLFDGLDPGTYAVCVMDPGDIYLDQCYNGFDIPASGERTITPITLHSGDALDLVDINLHIGSTITGTLTDSLTFGPIANGAEFVLYSSTQQVLATFDAPVDADGHFTIGGVAHGSYYLEAGVPYFLFPANSYYVSALHAGAECHGNVPPCIFTEASLFSVPADGTASGVDFQLRPGHLVSGTVRDSETGLGIGGVTVAACEWLGLIRTTAQSTTSADGVYTLSHVVGPGEISLRTSNALGYVDVLWPNFPFYGASICSFEGPGLTFNSYAQNFQNVDFSLVREGTISGHVMPSGAGTNATVEIFTYFGGSLGIAWSGSPDGNGQYQSGGLPPGTYYAVVYFDDYQDCRVYAGYECTDPSGFPPLDPLQSTPIMIAAGQQLESIDFPAVQEIFGSNFE